MNDNHDNENFDENVEAEETTQKRRRRSLAERDRDEMDKYVAAYDRKLKVKAKLEAKREEVARSKNEILKAMDEKIAPYEAEVSYLRKRIENFAPVTGDDVNDLLDPIDAAYFEYDELGVFSEENDKPESDSTTEVDEHDEA